MINTQATLKISEATTTEVQRSITFDRLTGLMLASVRTLSLPGFRRSVSVVRGTCQNIPVFSTLSTRAG